MTTETSTQPHAYRASTYGDPCTTCKRVPRDHTWPGEAEWSKPEGTYKVERDSRHPKGIRVTENESAPYITGLTGQEADMTTETYSARHTADSGRIGVTAWVTPSEQMINSQSYPDGRAVIFIEDHRAGGASLQIWVASTDADLAAERAALRKLANTAAQIARHLDGLIAAREMAAQAVQS